MKKRLISTVLALSMMAGLLPAKPIFAKEEAQLLPAVRSTFEGMPYGTYFTVGNGQETVEERGRYILTVYRDGDVSGEDFVVLKTADISARYGEDYAIDDDRYTTDVIETEGTYVQRFGDDEYLEATAQALEKAEESSEEYAEEYSAALTEALDEAGVLDTLTEAAPETAAEETQSDSDSEKSSLAAMKEAQTGHETRDTYETETVPFVSQILGDEYDIGTQMETSSATTITFAPGETEKQVIFVVFDDKESEGDEAVNFILSEPSGSAMVTEPFSAGIIIADDEEIEHPLISFSAARYTASDGVVRVYFKREEPTYPYVTAMVRSTGGTAVDGVNYNAFEHEIQFLPYRDETWIEIPVAAGSEELEFSMELYDIKGGEAGAITTAKAVIGAAETGGTAELYSEGGETAELFASNKVTIKDVEYDVEFNGNIGKITDEDKNVIGYYYKGNTFKYGNKTGDASSWTSKVDGEDGLLKWYNWRCWEKGMSYATDTYDRSKWQSIYLDYQTYSSYDSSKCGFYVNDRVMKIGSMTLYMPGTPVAVTNKQGREVRGPIKLLEDGNGGKIPATKGDTLTMFAERTAKYCVEPDMRIYGAIYLSRQFRVTTTQSPKITLKTAQGGTREAVPGMISVDRGAKEVYKDGTVVFIDHAAQGEAAKYGELVGLDIRCGIGDKAQTLKIRPERLRNKFSGSEYYIAPRSVMSDDCLTLNFTLDLIKKIDEKTGKVTETTNGFRTNLEVTPVYEKIPVMVNIIPADKNAGTFKSQYLKKSSTDQLFVGDEISLDAEPSSNDVFYHYFAYKSWLYTSGGAPSADISAAPYETNKTMRLLERRYEFKPLFESITNHIGISASREVSRYFTVRGTISGDKTGLEGLAGKTLLVTDGTDTVIPVVGKAYTIELIPKEGVTLPEGRRPVIKSDYNKNNYVNGYRMDILAQANYKENQYTIAMEDVSGDYEYFSLSGKALYTSFALLDNTSPMQSEPAIANSVTAGGWLSDAYTSSGDEVKNVTYTSDITDEDGSFEINGVKAIKGDRISVKASNNNVDQVIYVTMNGGEPVQKTFTETQADEDTYKNLVKTVTASCTPIDLNVLEMPVRTNYSPYINQVTMTYSKSNVAGGTTAIPIDDADTLFVDAHIVTNNIDVKQVEFILFNREGVSKAPIKPIFKEDESEAVDSSGGEQDDEGNKDPSYIYRTEAPDESGWCSASIPGEELIDGDMLYVRIISNETNSSDQYLTYPIMNVGARFYTPIKDHEPQVVQVDVDQIGDLPMIGDLASSIDSGAIKWQTTYADEKHKSTSAYLNTLSIAADIYEYDSKTGGDWANTYDFNRMRGKVASEKKDAGKTNDQIVQEYMDNFNPGNITANMSDRSAKQYQAKIDAENAKRAAADPPQAAMTADEMKDKAKKYYEQDAYKNNLNKFSKWKVTFGAKVVFSFLYAYSEEKNTHIFVGGEYLIGGYCNVSATVQTAIGPVPVFVNVTGEVNVDVDGAWLNDDDVDITAKEIQEEPNVLNVRYKNAGGAIPWVQLGVSVKIKAGVGYCGVVSVYGMLKLAVVGRFTFTGNQRKDTSSTPKDSAGGFMVDFSGGLGVQLFIVSVELQLGRIKQGWGVFNTGGPITEGPKLLEYDENGDAYDTLALRPFELGNEQEVTNDAQLMSTLQLVGEPRDLVTDTMETLEPEAVRISDDGKLFVVYLSNNKQGDTANASQIKYKIRNTDGTYTEGVPVSDNGVGDASPAVMYVPETNKVYVAWTSADTKLDNLSGKDEEDVETTKENLKKLNIYMAVYDVGTGVMSEPVTVVDDSFENTNVRLVNEDGDVALYYFKRDMSKASDKDDLISMTANYNTWAKKVYDTTAGEFKLLGKTAGGADYTEEFIDIAHPKLTDPLVMDLSVTSCVFDGGDLSNTQDDINYSLMTYTVDTDGDFMTTSDREIWIKVTDLTSNKAYYPIKVDSGKQCVSNPQLTKAQGDVMLTWLSDTSIFNLISWNDVFGALRYSDYIDENTPVAFEDSVLGHIVAMSQEEASDPKWLINAVNKASPDNEHLVGYANGSLPSVTKDMGKGVKDEASRQEAAMLDYRIVRGDDDNVYLFWTEADNAPDKLGSKLYASAFFRINDEWMEEYGNENTVTVGFSDPVVISEHDLNMDEMTAVVTKDSEAVIIANTYKTEFVPSEDPKVNPIVNGPHNLTEFRFEPVNSLEIVDGEINFSDPYPKPGEEVTVSFTLKNTGLLPTKGDIWSIKVTQGDSIIYEESETEHGGADIFYVGEEYLYETEPFTLPDSLDGLKYEIIISETTDDTSVLLSGDKRYAGSVLVKENIQIQDPYIKSYQDIVEDIEKLTYPLLQERIPNFTYDMYDLDMEDFSEADQQILKDTFWEVAKSYYPDLSNMPIFQEGLSVEDMFDYILYLPVRNTGNKAADVEAKLRYVNDSMEITDDILGETMKAYRFEPVSPENDDVTYIAIPFCMAKEQFGKYGIIHGSIDLYVDGELYQQDIRAVRSESSNMNMELLSADNVALTVGETSAIETFAYPFDSHKQLTFVSSDPEVAMVSADGTITALSNGTATIKVTEAESYVEHNVTVTVTGGTDSTPTPRSGGSGSGGASSIGSPSYTVTAASGINGSIKTSAANAKEGTKVTITVTPDAGYEADTVKITDTSGNEVAVTKNSDGTYTFTQPASKVDVNVTFKKTADAADATPAPSSEPTPPSTKPERFIDVKADDWFYDAVNSAADNGIVNGMTENTYEPQRDLTRAMFAAMIHRYDGSQPSQYQYTFEDVPDNMWYTDDIRWAAENGIITGYDDTTFAPDDPITREQAVAMMYRYTNFKGVDTSAADDSVIMAYSDYDMISGYAVPAFTWARTAGVINGRSASVLAPRDNITRAEIAQIFTNYTENVK